MACKWQWCVLLPGLAYKTLLSASLLSFPSHELIHTGAPDLAATILLRPKFKGDGELKQIEPGSLNDHVEQSTLAYLNYSLSSLFEKEISFFKPRNYCWTLLLQQSRLILINKVINERIFVWINEQRSSHPARQHFGGYHSICPQINLD